MQKLQVQSLRGEYPWEKGMAIHYRILAWKIQWTEEPGRPQSWGPHWETNTFTFHKYVYPFKIISIIDYYKILSMVPYALSRALVVIYYICSSDFPGDSVKRSHLPMQETGDAGSIPGLGRSPEVGNGKLFQYSCLENPMDRERNLVGYSPCGCRVGHNWAHTHFTQFFFFKKNSRKKKMLSSKIPRKAGWKWNFLPCLCLSLMMPWKIIKANII